ncbi:MAG: hypothetical protein H8E66_33405 [Planctomycetes bacterium]|nr:hypothetical protein [Planctomycetota bacterium]
MNSLAYFHAQAKRRREHRFQLNCQPHGRLQSTDSHFREIVQHKVAKGESTLSNGEMRSCVFAEMDTADVNLRVIVIPNSRVKKFFSVRASYQKSGVPDSTRGYLAHLCQKLNPEYNLWTMATHTSESDTRFERGGIRILAEAQSDDKIVSNSDVKSKATDLKTQLESNRFQGAQGQDWKTKASVDPLTAIKVERMIDKEWKSNVGELKYDVFISYDSDDKAKAEKIYDALDRVGLSEVDPMRWAQNGVV